MARPGRPRMPKAPLPGTVDAFLDMLIAERGAALNTRHAYERDLADVCAFLKKASKEIDNASTGDLKAYLNELGARENAKSKGGGKTAVRTIARRISMRSERPTISLMVRKPSSAMCSGISCAMKCMKLTT